MKRFTTLFLSCVVCASMTFAQDAKPFKATYANQLERVQQTEMRSAARSQAEALLSEDFSKFTKGTEAAPDNEDIGNNGAIPDEYTQTPGWKGSGVYQAGGVAYIGTDASDMMGYLKTPEMDLTANNGFFTVKFRAKSTSADGDVITVKNYLTGAYFDESSSEVSITNEWKEYTVQMNAGAATSYIQLTAENGDWLVDDITVACDGVPCPEGLSVSGYTGTSAKLSWNPVEGADYYVINLYYFSMDTFKYEYLKKDERVDGTTVTVTGLDSKETYFWQVATVKDGMQSAYSDQSTIKITKQAPETYQPTDYDGTQFTASWEDLGEGSQYKLSVYSYINGGTYYEERVPFLEQTVSTNSFLVTGLDENTIYYYTVQGTMQDGEITMISKELQVQPNIAAPEVMQATDVTSTSFVANWGTVKRANKYLATVYKEHTATAEETYALADGNFESYTTNETSNLTLPRETGAGMWYINYVATKDGCIGIDNSLVHVLGYGYMYSPLYDLTPFGGKASFDITLASDDATMATISLAEIGAGNVLNEIETFKVPVSKEMTTQHVEFTKGSKQCCVLIHFDLGYYLYIKDLKLTVDMPEGSKIEIPFDSKITESTDEQKFAVDNLEVGANDRLSYDVVAALSNDEIYVESPKSDRMYVDFTTSINDLDVMQTKPAVKVYGNELYVENPKAETVEVFNVDGMKMYSDKSGDAVVKTTLSGRGIYIVKVGNKVTKVCAGK